MEAFKTNVNGNGQLWYAVLSLDGLESLTTEPTPRLPETLPLTLVALRPHATDVVSAILDTQITISKEDALTALGLAILAGTFEILL